jgi:hypothetical protein
MIKFAAFSFIIFFAFVQTLHAALNLSMSADRTKVAVGEQIIVTVKAISDRPLKSISATPLAPSDYYAVVRTNRNQSQSSSIQIINGKMVQKREITYLFYYYLAAKKPGTFTIPGLAISAGGQTATSNALTITVTKQAVVNPNLRVRLRAGKNRLYVGEQGIITFEVSQKPNTPINLTNQGFGAAVDAIYKACGKNFSVSRLFSDKIGKSQKRIGGEIYVSFAVSFSIIGIKPGTFSIGPIPFEYQELHRSRRRDPFDDFFGGFFRGGVQAVAKSMASNALSVTVATLPSPPPEFSGAVGTFSLDAAIDPAQIPAGEAATLSITLRGSTRPGNIRDIQLGDMSGFEVFSPEKHTYVDTTSRGIKTRKTYKYLIIPQQEGVKEIEPIRWVYFNPSAGKYKTLQSKPLALKVTRGKKAKGGKTRYLTQAEIREIGSDIRYIKTPSHLVNQSTHPHRNPLFLILYPLPLIFAAFSFLFRLQAQQRQRDFGRVLRGRAYRNACSDLRRLHKNVASIKAEAAASRIYEIIERYISHRFGFAAAGKTLDELREEFTQRAASAETISSITAFLEKLDTIRFSRQLTQGGANSTFIDKARLLLEQLQKSAKAEKKK